MKQIIFFAICLLLLGKEYLIAQNIAINGNGDAAAASSILDVKSTNKGLLIPRVALTATATTTGDHSADAGVPNPANKLLVVNTNTAVSNGSGIYYYDSLTNVSGKWVYVVATSNGPGTSGQVLTSAGSGAPPAWGTLSTGCSGTWNSTTYTATGANTWTQPSSSVINVFVFLVGGGGGGGGAYRGAQWNGGGGGGGGGVTWAQLTPMGNLTITIGGGGAGGASETKGTAGTATTVTNNSGLILIRAGGGDGGYSNGSASATLGAQGGDGGIGNTGQNGRGGCRLTGDYPGNGHVGNGAGGGNSGFYGGDSQYASGGVAAGTSNDYGGGGGASYGAGAAGAANTAVGNAASANTGGGGSGGGANSSEQAGGAGGSGFAIIYWLQ
jgi:hypothetical protein